VKITLLYQENDPYCNQAKEALDHIRIEEGFQDLQLVLIDVKDDHQDYPKLPVVLLNNEKIYEAEDGENYQQCKEKLRKAIV
jgi:glutaredoxin